MTISVVIPCYNAERFIARAIQSVLAQHLRPKEIIVVDDGSTDDVKTIISSYGDQVQYIYQENAGSGKARNVGINIASSEYIAFLDSDDYWDAEHLETMLQTLKDTPAACLVYCGKKWVDENGILLTNAFKQNNFPGGWIFRQMFESNYISSSSVVLARKEALVKAGMFGESQKLRNAQDYHLWLRMSAMYTLASSSQETVNYRRHDSNRTQDEVSRQRGLLHALETAVSLLNEGGVDERNVPEQINVQKRMRQYFQTAVTSLYFSENYPVAREFCLLALKKGYWTMHLGFRFFLTVMPASFRSAIPLLKKIMHR